MPLFLLAAAAVPAALWATNREVEKSGELLIKGAAICAVAYVAWVNRDAIAKLVKV